jgi:4-amino-4-deoxy-L-arabinose transferase-like glycosyltransferase
MPDPIEPQLDELRRRARRRLIGAIVLALAAAVLAAVSPALTFYSRFYIQESLFVFFTLGFLVALGRFAERPGAWRAVCAGALAGLAYATKETSVIVLPAAAAAVASSDSSAARMSIVLFKTGTSLRPAGSPVRRRRSIPCPTGSTRCWPT